MSTETIFVSYSSKDRPFALGLVKELQNLGANVWIDQLGIGLGENWDNAIEQALEKSETLMLILSPTAVSSQNVQDEVSIAINTNKKMVPILIKECELPMRWQRRQYADLANNPEKAINDILNYLGLQEKAAASIKGVLKLIGVSEAPIKTTSKVQDTEDNQQSKEVKLDDLLVSEAELVRAAQMHKKGLKKDWKRIIILALVSFGTFAFLGLTDFITVPFWIVATGSLALNLLSIAPFGNIKKRERYIDLMDLLKLKRKRLIRVMNKLTTKEIEDFNTEFYSYVKK